VDEAQRVAAFQRRQRAAQVERRCQPPPPEVGVDDFALIPRQQAYLDLAAPVEIATGEPGAGSIHDLDKLAILDAGWQRGDGAAEDPRMALANRLVAPALQDDRVAGAVLPISHEYAPIPSRAG